MARPVAEIGLWRAHVACGLPEAEQFLVCHATQSGPKGFQANPFSPARSYIANLAVAPSHLQLERWPLLSSGRPLRRLLLLAPDRWRLAFRFQLRQFELDDGYGFFDRFELVADAFDGFRVTHRSLVSSKRPEYFRGPRNETRAIPSCHALCGSTGDDWPY